MFNAIQKNRYVQALFMKEHLFYFLNTTSGDFEWCLRTNGTYLDCPLNGKTEDDFILGIHNPSV